MSEGRTAIKVCWYLWVSRWFYRQSLQNPRMRMRVLYKVSCHSNILKGWLACANRKCGSGEDAERIFRKWGSCEESSKTENLHTSSIRSTFSHASKTIELRSHGLAAVSSTFSQNELLAAATEWKANPALFEACTNVLLACVMSTCSFSSIFMKSEYATFSIVAGARSFYGIRKALLL